MTKTWFITGTSRGFGRAWAQAALQRGDQVAATARDISTLDDLVATYRDAILPIPLDVTDQRASVAAVQQAHRHFGSLDVVINNAGYGHFGFIEELSSDDLRRQLETNLFGALWITQAAIPLMREQGSGHILQVSSIGGVTAFPGLGAYHASKWALEGFSEALAQEVGPSGITVTIIEPGGYATDWAGASAAHSEGLAVYQPFRDAMTAQMQDMDLPSAESTVAAVLAAVDAPEPPLRLLLSGAAYEIVTGAYANRLQVWADWESVSRTAA
jgi:NAD(P)-dependent dehydrogenase (short-subunit alcohol dehydrogenase family)